MNRRTDRGWDDDLADRLAELDYRDINALTREIASDVKSKERRTGGKLFIVLTHEPTGVTISHLCGASRSQSDRDAFVALVERMEHLSTRPRK
jgi:hypothetical protein